MSWLQLLEKFKKLIYRAGNTTVIVSEFCFHNEFYFLLSRKIAVHILANISSYIVWLLIDILVFIKIHRKFKEICTLASYHYQVSTYQD